MIEDLRSEGKLNANETYDAVMLKALLVHGASWFTAYSVYEKAFATSGQQHMTRAFAGRFLGYGEPDVARVTACTDQRVTLLGFGTLGDGEADVFSLPLPPSLSSSTEDRRLTVTLAWLSPINPNNQNYRGAHLWFDATENNDIAPSRREGDYHAVQRGTVQHEILEGQHAVPFQDGDSVALKVNCRSDAGKLEGSVRYCLAVTLEVREGTNIPIYNEVATRLAVRVPLQTRI